MRDIPLQGADALVLFGDSERNCDLLWATGFRAPDAFLYIATAEQAWIVVKDLEVDRATEQVQDAEVLASRLYEERIDDTDSNAVLLEVLRERGVKRVRVPDAFPVGSADRLREAGLQLDVAPAPLFPGRSIKRSNEIDAIGRAQRAAEAAIVAGWEALRAATIDGDGLRLDGQTLTSEMLRRIIDRVLIEHECVAMHTIVAGGEQAIDPHQVGFGPLPAHKPIIMDVFPQHVPSGYFGDITRTVVRGTPTDEVVALHKAVADAQADALAGLRAGVDGKGIHTAVCESFEAAGYETGERDGRQQGYFHGTGHGVGLEIHEAPSVGRRSCPLETDQVVTVEPGLYYAGLGGVRIEDLVVIEPDGIRNLTTLPKELVL